MKDAYAISDEERKILEDIDKASKPSTGINYEQFFKTHNQPETNKLLLELKQRKLIDCEESLPLGKDSEKCYPIKLTELGKTAIKRGRQGWNI